MLVRVLLLIMVGKRSINLKFTNNILNNKKSGFTLAEVLITLSVIGVVAVVTMPAMYVDMQNRVNGAKLASIVSEVENAFKNVIIENRADNLYETELWDKSLFVSSSLTAKDGNKKAFATRLAKYLPIYGEPVSDDSYYGAESVCAMSESGKKGTGNACKKTGQRIAGHGQLFAMELEKGGVLLFRGYNHENELQASKINAAKSGSSYNTNAADIIIDVNGKKKPNTFGRDIFWFQMGENGTLYPEGSREVALLDNWIDVETQSSTSNGNWNTTKDISSCTDKFKGTDETLRGMGCAARVVAEGFKIKY